MQLTDGVTAFLIRQLQQCAYKPKHQNFMHLIFFS